MGKHKTNKAVAKRFRRSAGGKLLYGRAGKSHLNTHKSRGRKRRLGRAGVVSEAFTKQLSNMLGK